MLWGCVANSGTGALVKVKGRMNSTQYQQILQDNVQASVKKLKFCRGWIFQQDDDAKHTSTPTKEFMQREKYNKSPDLKIIENVWGVLKQAVHALQPLHYILNWSVLHGQKYLPCVSRHSSQVTGGV